MAAVTGGANITLASIEDISINSIATNSVDLLATSAKSLTFTGDSAITVGEFECFGRYEGLQR